MGQLEEQHIHSPVGTQVIQHGVDPPQRGGQPALYPFQEVQPVRNRAPCVGSRQGVTRCRTEGAKHVAALAAAIVDLLAGAARWAACRFLTRRPHHDALARPTLGRLWPHLIQTHDNTPLRRLYIERFSRPLFAAKSGSTRSPNQVSCLRQRKPSVSNISLTRLRFMAIPLRSLRYATNRSSVQDAKGKPNVCGSVSAVATISPTCSRL